MGKSLKSKLHFEESAEQKPKEQKAQQQTEQKSEEKEQKRSLLEHQLLHLLRLEAKKRALIESECTKAHIEVERKFRKAFQERADFVPFSHFPYYLFLFQVYSYR
jgi:hypothetical protein